MLAEVARAPRPVASPENRRTRDWLLERIRRQGWECFTQEGDVEGIRVANVVGRASGDASTASVLLAAHFDTVPGSPGAADDGAGVAVLAEVMRALANRPALRNDVVVLLSDGEERHMLGAKLFRRSEIARDVGFVINIDCVGRRRPAVALETNFANPELLRALQGPAPVASSLSPALYGLLPLDTDFSVLAAGVSGVNFTLVGGAHAYHKAYDRADLVDPSSLQHLGDSVLALVEWAGSASHIPRAPGPSSFQTLPVLGIVSWSSRWNLTLSALATAVLIFGFRFGVAPALTGRSFLFVAATVVSCAAAAGGSVWLVTNALGPLHEGWSLLGVLYLCTGISVHLSGSSPEPERSSVAYVGGSGVLVVVLSIELLAAGASTPLQVPVLLTAAACVLRPSRSPGRTVLGVACTIGFIALGAPVLGILFMAGGLLAPAGSAIVAAAVALVLAALLPGLREAGGNAAADWREG